MSTVKIEDILGVKKVSEGRYIGIKPLGKPSKASRGIFGGFIAAQALIVAMTSASPDYRPHSLHSFFVKPGHDDKPMEWIVENISNGKNFCNRSIQGVQDGDVKYVVSVSLTKRNSYKQTLEIYQEQERVREERAANGEDDDDESEIPAPFRFQTPYPEFFKTHKEADIEADFKGSEYGISYKLPKEMYDLDLTKEEDGVPVAERRLNYYVKLGNREEFQLETPQDQYAGLAVVSDSLFLTRLARVLRIPGLELNDTVHYLSTSLDHVIYFHDDDFDVSQWLAFSFHTLRFAEHRVLLEAEIFNTGGIHVATIVQEGLVYFNGIEKDAKL